MNTALLTIDDIASKNTPAIVDYLNEKGIRAIFFATGVNVERFHEEARYAVQHGMIVGNHSYSHPAFSALTMPQAIEEIETCEVVLDRLYRDSNVERRYRPFRFPYGDKGGSNRKALQQYLREKKFDKVDDRHIAYTWWKEKGLASDIDTFWTFDFEEYRMQNEPGFTKESVWAKMHRKHPETGEALFHEDHRHIVLMHAHDETEEILPQYYRLFLGHLLDHGMSFDEPAFIRQG